MSNTNLGKGSATKYQSRFLSQSPDKVPSASGAQSFGLRRRRLGALGEQRVVNHLLELGWKIQEVNWRLGRLAEIDIIATDLTDCLVIAEVKTRRVGPDFPQPGFMDAGFEKVDFRKQLKMKKAAQAYLSYKGFEACRFDAFVVFVYGKGLDLNDRVEEDKPPLPIIFHVQNIFT